MSVFHSNCQAVPRLKRLYYHSPAFLYIYSLRQMSSKQRNPSVPGTFQSSLKNMESTHKQMAILRCKVLVVGDACVGKTSLTQVFQSGAKAFPRNYMMTIAAEFGVKQIPIEGQNVTVELYIFDCAGQSIFNQLEMNSKYFENASAVMLVFDIGNIESLQSCTKWNAVTRERRSSPSALPGVLVGNKSDYRDGSEDSRAEVVKDDAKNLAQALSLAYFEASASNNTDVEKPFVHIAEQFYKRYLETVEKADALSGMPGV